ncbi:MAG: hypothetical protein Q7K41_07170 [Dehalococcoidales bacterium]|nr:hypothetical protein [Dehalococcoidales bacterium]
MDLVLKMVDGYPVLKTEAEHLAEQLFGNDRRKCDSFTNRLLDICARVQDKDIFIIHSPGGFGSTPMEHLLPWERSIVEGISSTIEQLGHRWLMIQHFRTGNSWWAHMKDMKEQTSFFFKGTSSKPQILVGEVKFIAQHFTNLKILLLGASQGAAFGNAVMRQIGELPQVYSIELGIFFPHMSRRVVTRRTLTIDSNGVMPDPISTRNLKAAARAYLTSPWRWVRYRLQGKPQKFTYCINAPGHNYNWEYPEVQQRIRDFLNLDFGNKDKQEVTVK